MSRYCGELRQVAFVVDDADAMMRNWTQILGVGPFFVRRAVSFDEFRYRGKPSPSPVLTLAIAHSGALQIEIIQQHDDAPSGYLDFLRARGSGMQHACSWYGKREDYLSGYRKLEEAGLECIHEGRARGMDIRFAYFSRAAEPGAIQMEIAEALDPKVIGYQQMVEAAARTWDGRDPIREIANLHDRSKA